MIKFLASLSILTVTFFVGIWVSIVGWGLEPANWPVIIGGWFIGVILHACVQLVNS